MIGPSRHRHGASSHPSSLIILRIQSIGSGGSLIFATSFCFNYQPSFLAQQRRNRRDKSYEYILQYETQGAGPNRLAPNGKRSERSTIREASPTLQKILRCPFSIFRIFIVVIFESNLLKVFCVPIISTRANKKLEPCPGITSHSHSSSNSSNNRRTARRRCPFCPRRRGLRSMTSSTSTSSTRPSTIPATSATLERHREVPALASASAGVVEGSLPSPC